MKRLKQVARRLTVSLIGFPLLLVGIILIPLPGPGLLVSFVAVLILSLEFDWAGTKREQIKQEFKKIYAKAQARADKVEQWGEKSSKNKQ